MHSVSFPQIHSGDDDDDNDELNAKVTSHETVLTSHETNFCAFHYKIVSYELMLQQKSEVTKSLLFKLFP